MSKLTQRCKGSKPMVLIHLITTVKVAIFATILRHIGNPYGTPTVKLTAKTQKNLVSFNKTKLMELSGFELRPIFKGFHWLSFWKNNPFL